jgi:hypothetical protein
MRMHLVATATAHKTTDSKPCNSTVAGSEQNQRQPIFKGAYARINTITFCHIASSTTVHPPRSPARELNFANMVQQETKRAKCV